MRNAKLLVIALVLLCASRTSAEKSVFEELTDFHSSMAQEAGWASPIDTAVSFSSAHMQQCKNNFITCSRSHGKDGKSCSFFCQRCKQFFAMAEKKSHMRPGTINKHCTVMLGTLKAFGSVKKAKSCMANLKACGRSRGANRKACTVACGSSCLKGITQLGRLMGKPRLGGHIKKNCRAHGYGMALAEDFMTPSLYSVAEELSSSFVSNTAGLGKAFGSVSKAKFCMANLRKCGHFNGRGRGACREICSECLSGFDQFGKMLHNPSFGGRIRSKCRAKGFGGFLAEDFSTPSLDSVAEELSSSFERSEAGWTSPLNSESIEENALQSYVGYGRCFWYGKHCKKSGYRSSYTCGEFCSECSRFWSKFERKYRQRKGKWAKYCAKHHGFLESFAQPEQSELEFSEQTSPAASASSYETAVQKTCKTNFFKCHKSQGKDVEHCVYFCEHCSQFFPLVERKFDKPKGFVNKQCSPMLQMAKSFGGAWQFKDCMTQTHSCGASQAKNHQACAVMCGANCMKGFGFVGQFTGQDIVGHLTQTCKALKAQGAIEFVQDF